MEQETVEQQPGQEIRGYLKKYYGRVLKQTADLEQKACCANTTMARFTDILALIPDEVRQRNYGCGCTVPSDDLTGLRVLDLGSGAGLDAFILSKLVGDSGHVQGVDMTDEQLEVARRNQARVAKAFGYSQVNTEFLHGYIETVEPVESASIDLVISNCVINLSPLKNKVFETIYRVLKPGGEFYISDIVADRHVPEEIRRDPKMVAECLGNAPYEHDLFDIMKDSGFADPRLVSRTPIDQDVNGQPIRFYSSTIRGCKLESPLDRRCEDFGQFATYRGTCDLQPARFVFDDHHGFEAHRPTAVCRNTARMLSETRLGRYFEVTEPVRHFGIFPCGPEPVSTDPGSSPCC